MKFCLSDPLLKHVLGQVEKFPEATFTETELRKISPDGFQEMLKNRLLKYQQSDPDKETFPCPTPCEKGCDRVIGNIHGSFQAICPEHSSVKPISLAKSDLERYIFDIDRLMAEIKKKNQLVGFASKISERIRFVGERSMGQKHVSVVLGLFRNGKEADAVLLGLSNQISIHDRTIVLLPFFDKTSQDVLMRLESQNVFVSRFEEVFPKSDFVIDFARLERKKPKVGTEHHPMTQKQQRDTERYEYKCKDRLYLTGKEPKKRSNLVRLNDREIIIPESEMLLLLYLVMESKKEKGGWVFKEQLYEEGITEEDIPHRLISRLRNRLSPGLLDKDAEKFIENDGKGRNRISTHPDFVIIEKRNWLVKKYNKLKESVRKERKRREDRKMRQAKVIPVSNERIHYVDRSSNHQKNDSIS